MRISSTRQHGASGSCAFTKSAAEPNDCVCRPTELKRSINASRSEVSSSTTRTVGAAATAVGAGLRFIADFSLPRNYELKGASAALITRRPYPPIMRLDDRAADRQAHSHTAWLGRKEGLKQIGFLRRVEAWTVIHDGQQDLVVLLTGPDHQLAAAACLDRGHRLRGIDHEVDDHQLQKEAIAVHIRQRAGQIERERHLMARELAPNERHAFL